MNILSIIDKKKYNELLSKEEIDFFVQGYVNGEIPDYQISSLLMAIRLNGLNVEETTDLTTSIVNSGDKLSYDDIGKIIIDKHSTGGVGDKTSLVLIPLLAALGFGVSKMSGRGLGFTGGTIDKLESLEGFNVDLTEKKIYEFVKEVGCIIVGQSEHMVPADKKLYALRDVTSTVDSVGLIASSIMSKKIALGAEIILLDVKYGSGGFMKTKEEAVLLANRMRDIGQKLNRKVICFITSMEQPLGNNIGNGLEVREAYETLCGYGNFELRELCVSIATEALVSTGMDRELALEEVNSKIDLLQAKEKFDIMIKKQGYKHDKVKLSMAKHVYELKALKSGFINEIKANDVGFAVMLLGAGRQEKGDVIDHEVGLELLLKVGDKVSKGDTLINIHYNDKKKLEECLDVLKSSYVILDKEILAPDLIEEIIK